MQVELRRKKNYWILRVNMSDMDHFLMDVKRRFEFTENKCKKMLA